MPTEIETLQTQLRELNDRLADAKRDEKRVALDAIREQVPLYGISEEELLTAAGFRKPRKRRAATKYYDPSSGKEWSGFGPRPKWLEGKNLDDYLVDRAPKPWWPEKEA
ncbi:histone family protein nucleoid-structuring protein H-NS [Burkholderia lata]|uniref:Histone family protein nucleoid-structuring protein H-NS n=1 Tax=Burkholderia lata (strain ATCC 17760 / DSM 23089 / LMG 22485 / NCIMB 9086 / R18194 / 383) TaxID=482957 RepID=A0A6P2RWZ0_BURL3|nr:H-NS histone family protein [Burkholderia lata]VWC41749.1 histone family protein nucleoid-structuring protein H-NS [Burkholderia lata]